MTRHRQVPAASGTKNPTRVEHMFEIPAEYDYIPPYDRQR
jgi:hypothetical protein